MDPSDAAVTESAASTDPPSHHDPLPHHPPSASRSQQHRPHQQPHSFPAPALRHPPPQPQQPPPQPRSDARPYPPLMLQGLSHPPQPHHLESHRPHHPPLVPPLSSGTSSTSKLWQHFIKGEKMQKTNKFFAHCVYCRKINRDSNTRGERRMMSAHLANCTEAPPPARAEALAISKDLKLRRSILSIGKKTRGASSAAASLSEGIGKRRRSAPSLHPPMQPAPPPQAQAQPPPQPQDAIVGAAAAAAAAAPPPPPPPPPPHPQDAVASYFDPMGTPPPLMTHDLRHDMARSGHMSTNDNVRLYYEELGNGHPLILIHGLATSCKYFDSNFRELALRFRVIRYDLRGHGDSEKPERGFHVHRLAADLRDMLVHFQFEKVALLGCASGCAVIWAFVELYGPSQISAAMFVDQSPYPLYSADGTWRLGSKLTFCDAALTHCVEQLVNDPRAFHEKFVRACFTRDPSTLELTMFVNESLKCHEWFTAKLLTNVTCMDWRSVLPTVSCPALVIAGKKSKVFPWEGVAFAAQSMPHAKLIPFEEGSHGLYIEEAMRFNNTVSAFLQSIVSGGTG